MTGKKMAFGAVGIFMCLVITAALWVGILAGKFLYVPPEDEPGREVLVLLEPGITLQRAAWILKNNGVVTDASYFILLAELKSAETSIRAGEYMMNTSWRPDQVLEALTRGKPAAHKLLITEGLPHWAVGRIISENGLCDYDKFAGIIKDAALLKEYAIPFDSAEGFLFPDTYQVIKDFSGDPTPLVKRLLGTFWAKTSKVWNSFPPDPEEVKKIVILASLVEKETSKPEERRRVAGVFANRLRLGMLLQCDPTVIYGLGPSFSGRLTRSQLADKNNLYNTYAHPGLPPGPICSPGLASIEAAADPEVHDYLYFVAKGNGGHQFSRTLREHNTAVFQYRRIISGK